MIVKKGKRDTHPKFSFEFDSSPKVILSQCLIGSNIENKNKHHVHCPSFGMYTFLTDSQNE